MCCGRRGCHLLLMMLTAANRWRSPCKATNTNTTAHGRGVIAGYCAHLIFVGGVIVVADCRHLRQCGRWTLLLQLMVKLIMSVMATTATTGRRWVLGHWRRTAVAIAVQHRHRWYGIANFIELLKLCGRTMVFNYGYRSSKSNLVEYNLNCNMSRCMYRIRVNSFRFLSRPSKTTKTFIIAE